MSKWNIEEICGYKPVTKIYDELGKAEKYGMGCVIEIYASAMKRYRQDHIYLTELAMALNWKAFEHKADNLNLSDLYFDLFGAVDKYAKNNLKGDELRYYCRTTD